MKKYTCKQCGKVYENNYSFKTLHCSKECRYKRMFTGKITTCLQCGKETYRVKSKFIWKKTFCNKNCYFLYRREHVHGRINPTKELRLKILEAYDYTCAYCKVNKHEPMKPLQLHHLDGGVINTVFENLVPLCISCHRKTQKL